MAEEQPTTEQFLPYQATQDVSSETHTVECVVCELIRPCMPYCEKVCTYICPLKLWLFVKTHLLSENVDLRTCNLYCFMSFSFTFCAFFESLANIFSSSGGNMSEPQNTHGPTPSYSVRVCVSVCAFACTIYVSK